MSDIAKIIGEYINALLEAHEVDTIGHVGLGNKDLLGLALKIAKVMPDRNFKYSSGGLAMKYIRERSGWTLLYYCSPYCLLIDVNVKHSSNVWTGAQITDTEIKVIRADPDLVKEAFSLNAVNNVYNLKRK